MPDKKLVFEVYALDVYQEDGDWIENERHWIGKLEISPISGGVDESDILTAMHKFTYTDWTGDQRRALLTANRRWVYAKDYCGDGTQWEIGAVKEGIPAYRLKLVENCGREEEM